MMDVLYIPENVSVRVNRSEYLVLDLHNISYHMSFARCLWKQICFMYQCTLQEQQNNEGGSGDI